MPSHPPPAPDLDAARALVQGASCWIVSDGKAGDEAQCIGIAERLNLPYEVRRVAPRAPYVWLMPWGSIDPREGPARPGSPLAGIMPDIAIASGRRTVSYLRKVKALSRGRTFTTFLKDPRIGRKAADFIWVPQHDRLRGDNVLATLTSPHRISTEALAAAGEKPPHGLAAIAGRKIAVLIGGDSRHYQFSTQDCGRLADGLRSLAAAGDVLLATPSRRTPEPLLQEIRAIVQASDGLFWGGAGQNPLLAMLALADVILVTADSVNMVGEAVATGKPVYVFTPTGGNRKINSFLSALEAAGAIRAFQGDVPAYTYPAIDSTPVIAAALAQRYADHRARLRNAT